MVSTINVKSEIIEINVGINNNSDDAIPTSTFDGFNESLPDYRWTVANTTYVFHTNETGRDQTFNNSFGNLSVLIMGGGQDEHFFASFPGPFGTRIKDNIENFILNGGGFIGHCAGGDFPIERSDPYVTNIEKIYHKSAFLDTNITVTTHYGEVFLSEFMSYDTEGNLIFTFGDNQDPTRMGTYAYLYYSGWNYTNESHLLGADV